MESLQCTVSECRFWPHLFGLQLHAEALDLPTAGRTAREFTPLIARILNTTSHRLSHFPVGHQTRLLISTISGGA